MSCTLEPAIWSRDTGQQVSKEGHGKPRLHVSVNLLFGVWPPCCATQVVVVVRTRPRAIPLAMITMRKFIDGFLFLSLMSMGLRLAALRAAGAPLSCLINSCHIKKSALPVARDHIAGSCLELLKVACFLKLTANQVLVFVRIVGSCQLNLLKTGLDCSEAS